MGRNLTPALRYGELVILNMYDYPQFNALRATEKKGVTKRLLEDYNPETDYILPLGDPIWMGYCIAVVGMKHGKVRVLKFDRQNQCYNPVELRVFN